VRCLELTLRVWREMSDRVATLYSSMNTLFSFMYKDSNMRGNQRDIIFFDVTKLQINSGSVFYFKVTQSITMNFKAGFLLVVSSSCVW